MKSLAQIIKQIGVLSKSPKGWMKDLNLISWDGREPNYDIREYSSDYDMMGKALLSRMKN